MRDYVCAALVVLLAGLGVWQLSTEEPAPPISERAEIAAVEPEATARRRAPEDSGLAPFRPGVIGGQAPAAPGEGTFAAIEAAPPARSAALPASLVMRIGDRDGNPLAGIRVILLAGTHKGRSAVTGGAGEAAFENLAAGRYGYRIIAPGRPELRPAAAFQLAAGATRVIEVTLGDYDQAIAGWVLDQDGAPVAGLTVKARLYRPPAEAGIVVPQSQAEQRAETALDSWFEIGGLEASEYEVRTVADDLYHAATTVVRAGTDAVRLTVVERRELAVSGQVTSTAGEPLADVRVVYLGQPSRRTRTDGEGWYDLAVALREEEGPRFGFDREGYQAERLDLDAALLAGSDGARLDATLEPVGDTVDVSVRLVDEDVAPVAGERVYLFSYGLGTHYQAVSDARGRAIFPRVVAGSDYGVRVAPRGLYKDSRQEPVDLKAPADLEIVLEALSVGRLSGHMIDLAGAPVPKFSLRLQSADAWGKWRQVSGDADGYFEVEVPTGSLTFHTVSMPQLQITGVDMDAGDDAYALLVLDLGEADLEGRVVDASGNPLTGAEVNLHWAHSEGGVQSRSTRRTVTDSGGAFLLSRLGHAPHRLEVATAGYGTHRQTLQPGAAWVEVRLEPSEP